jgi:hypothetical protein
MTLKAELRLLRLHALVTTGAIVVLVSTGFTKQSSAKFETIDVERINIIEKNGQVRLVISNKARSPAPIERGQAFGYQPGNRAGMIFYNEEGTEQGGITYTGQRDSVGNYQAVGSLTFDQYEQDQTVALQYFDQNGRRRAGLAINDYPLGMSGLQFDRRYQRVQAMKDSAARADSMKVLDALSGRQRLYAGRGRNGSSLVSLSDPGGKVRLRLSVDTLGAAKIEFLSEAGNVIKTINESR